MTTSAKRFSRVSRRACPKRTRCGCLSLRRIGKSTWKLVDALGEAAQAKYWSEVDAGLDSRLRCGE